MLKQPRWDKYEVAILIDKYSKMVSNGYDKDAVVHEVSDLLRARAISNGRIINEQYRNIAGIYLMMFCLKDLFSDGKEGLKHYSKLFVEIYDLYKNNKEEFVSILREAYKQCDVVNEDYIGEYVSTCNDMKTEADVKIERKYSNRSKLKLSEDYILVALKGRNIEYVDERATGGKLWVIGGEKLKDFIYDLENKHAKFIFTSTGNMITNFREAWSTYSRIKETINKRVVYEKASEFDSEKEKNSLQTKLLKKDVIAVFDQSNADIEVSKKDNDTDCYEERVKFIEWMKNAGIALDTIYSFLSVIKQCSIALKEYGVAEVDLLAITDTDSMVRYRDELLTKTEFRKINEQQHNCFRVAFNKLIDYRSAGTSIKLTTVPLVSGNITKENPKIAIPDFSASGSSNADLEFERLDAILRENFSEGLLPNALRLDKFRMLYEDEYGTEPTQDDDLLISKLKKTGSFIDGRIYPKQDTQQNNLLAEMLTEIINTLNNGARCVYISCVMERWQQDLASQLSVYNEGTLRALLLSQKVPGLVIADYVLKATMQKVYPEENVVAVMKESHSGMTYQQIQEKIWYIPLADIKHALVTTPEIVNVDAETYFYAPNFPASASELQHLKMCLKSELAAKGYLVAQDIANIIHEKCHTIAINTADYKDWAYRNILKYIFRDDFEFSGAVVSEKGKSIELWHVFRNYCRDHERVTLDDLNNLKDELGVPIYWDTVRAETVRISIDEFVRRDLIHFNVDATDKVLDELCPGDYIALKDINLFLHFPAVEYPWNAFVLESYLQDSKAFKLYHVSYANHGAFGVMVRSNSKFGDYRAVVVDMLAHSNEWKNNKQALKLIVEKGYQARKRWTNFEQVTQEASLIREKIEAERK